VFVNSAGIHKLFLKREKESDDVLKIILKNFLRIFS